MDNTTDADNVQHVDTPADTTVAELQKLKENFRLVVNKMNEICKVNTVMLEKLKALSDDNEKLVDENDELYDQKVDLTTLDQYGRRENVEFCNIPESM